MQSIELTKPLTTESLLREFESRFNQTMDLSKFTKEDLEDYANKVRTKIHEITQNTHFGQELKDDSYQKSQMMLDVLNQAIKEHQEKDGTIKKIAGTNIEVDNPDNPGITTTIDTTKVDLDVDDTTGDVSLEKEPEAGEKAPAQQKLNVGAKVKMGTNEGDMQDIAIMDMEAELGKINDEITFLKIDEKDKESALAALGALRTVLDKYQPKQSEAVKEGVEEQSELILAAKDMMDKVTGFLEDLASMKTEGMLELADRIRDEMGAEKSDAWMQKIQPAIEQAEATLSTTRQELDNGVRILTGEEVATDPMGSDDSMNMDEPDTDLGGDVDLGGDAETDEFGASDAEAGGTEPEGREQRESKEVFETSNRIYGKLAGK